MHTTKDSHDPHEREIHIVHHSDWNGVAKISWKHNGIAHWVAVSAPSLLAGRPVFVPTADEVYTTGESIGQPEVLMRAIALAVEAYFKSKMIDFIERLTIRNVDPQTVSMSAGSVQ